MKHAALAFALLVGNMAFPVVAQQVTPSTGPAFKGVELYSWSECTQCAWHFSLLLGTNRMKTLAEIKAPSQTLVGVPQLKEHLSRLPSGEQVFWLGPQRHRELSRPPAETIADILNFSVERNIVLAVVQ
jgi:hypothetical protein